MHNFVLKDRIYREISKKATAVQKEALYIFHLSYLKKTNVKLFQVASKIKGPGLIVNRALTPSVNVIAATNEAKVMLYLIQRQYASLTKKIFVPL